jgi:hypothetical protein
MKEEVHVRMKAPGRDPVKEIGRRSMSDTLITKLKDSKESQDSMKTKKRLPKSRFSTSPPKQLPFPQDYKPITIATYDLLCPFN